MTQIYLNSYLRILQMNSLKIGVELKKLVYKKRLGQGEFSYVSVESKSEAVGKKEIVDLLKAETSWQTLVKLKSPAESEESFCKTVKKQVQFVLFEDQFVKAAVPVLPPPNAEPKEKKPKLEPSCQDPNRVNISSIPDEEDEEIKPLDVRVFRLAAVPKVAGAFECEENVDETPVETVNIQKIEEDTEISNKVLIFNIDKTLSLKTLKHDFFDKISELTSVKKTVTADEKYRGVYLATFSSTSAAQKFVSKPIDLETKFVTRLEKILLRDYRVDKFLQRQIQKSRNFEKNQGKVIEALTDLKRTEKLAQCVVVEWKNADVDEEMVNEYFSGLESSFVENFELEDLPRKLDSPRTAKYVLIFQSEKDANDFASKFELHKIEDQTFKVTLLRDLMKKIRYGKKPKNFCDSQSNKADDNKRIIIGTVRKESNLEEVKSYFEKTFENVENIQRCMILDFFLGLYVLTFTTEADAKNALEIVLDVNSLGILKNPIIMSLVEYTERRAKFLKDLFPRKKRKRSGSESEDNSWVREFEDIKELHVKYWGELADEEHENDSSLEYEVKEEKTSENLSERLVALAK